MSSRLFAAGLGFVSVIAAQDGAAAELPRPCAAGACGPQVTAWVTSGSANATSTADTLTINQTSDRAVLNWASFDVSADGHVIFKQPGAQSIALNRIHQASPSKIFGTVEANGQIYLVNQNGFLFGATSSVKAAGLLASTLNLSDQVFNAGLLAPRGDQAALEAARDADGQPVKSDIVVENGAKLSTTVNSGRALLAASGKVDNAGTIETPGGQLILAAGEKVYLQPSKDPALRGILVEVDGGGEAFNRLTGQLNAAHGNITVVGLAVNQQGRISATTTVSQNGSVRLLARDTVDHDKLLAGTLTGTRGGTLELGAQGSISVLPDLKDAETAVDDQEQLPSSVELTGRKVFLRGGTQITAPGGALSVSAIGAAGGGNDPEARIRVESGAQINLAGSDVTLPVTRAMVQVELRANELKDSPNQRNGALRGQRVTIDARVGTPLADVSGALAAVPKGIAERTSKGGKVSFESQGDVIVADGATIDVSGGHIQYESGTIQTTKLMGADGKLYDIGTADPLRTYIAAINPTFTKRYDRWGVVETLPTSFSLARNETGYTEGRSAGTLQFVAPTMVLNGSLLGTATAGALQRDPAKVPLGGQLIIGTPLTDFTGLQPNYIAPSVTFVNQRPSIVVSDDASLPGPRTLELPVDLMTQGGFTRTEVYSNGVITLPENTPLDLLPGTSLTLVGERINLLSSITAPGGSIRATADQTFGIAGLELPRAGVRVGEGVSLDVRGLWTNDALALANDDTRRDPVFRDGGLIDLGLTTRNLDASLRFDAKLDIGSGASLLASGGAWVQSNGTIVGGRGGSISLRSGRVDPKDTQSALEVGDHVKLAAFGVQGARGGSFQLQTQRIEVVNDTGWTRAQRLDPTQEDSREFFTVGSSLFSDSGFSSITLLARGPTVVSDAPDAVPSRDTLVVRSGTTVDARTRTLQVQESARNRATGGTVEDITSVLLPPEVSQQASTISLRATPERAGAPGRLSLEAGSTLFASPRSTFDLQGIGGIALAGQITTAGGTIRALIDVPGTAADSGFRPDLMIDVASTASLDVSGAALLRVDDAGHSSGDVLAGGTISLLANRGSVAVRDGARLDVSGTAAAVDLLESAGPVRRVVASAGGTLELRAPESILFSGDLHASAGIGETGRAVGGSLSVQLTRFAGFRDSDGGAPFPDTPRVLRVVSDAVATGQNLPNGLGLIDTRTIERSGIDALRLESGQRVELSAGVNLSLGRQLVIDSPTIDLPTGGTVNLSAPYIAFGNSNVLNQPAIAATPGGGTLNVHADMLELTGVSSLQHVATALFDSSGDIRMRGVLDHDNVFSGALQVAGNVTLRAERVYPSTATKFSVIAAGGTDDIVRIEQAATTHTALPLSVAGSLRIEGKQIIQDGALLAPFGSLSLAATDSLTLTDRSVTSVTGNGGLFPFGQTLLADWVYAAGGVPTAQSAIPDRRISLSGDSVAVAPGATLDLRGGGDLYAYEWIPGTGGSKDALAAGVIPGLYAIVPGLSDGFAPFDPVEFAASDLKPGDSIHLSESAAGLAAGTYALLPARYALLPGSYLVQAVAGSRDLTAGQSTVLSDGTPIVSGFRTFANTGIGDTRAGGFSIRPGTYGRQLATYEVSLASDFFPARAQRLELGRAAIPADAASLALIAGTQLDARGKVLSAAEKGGRGASIEVAAEQLEITGAGAAANPASDAVQLSAQVLQQWNPAQLLLGGVRGPDGESVNVIARSVVFKQGAQLSLDQMLAVALDQVSLEAGATVKSNAAAGNRTIDALALPKSVITLSGAGAEAAVLGVSDLASIDVQRTHDEGATATGRLSIEDGALLASRGDLLLDAPAGGNLATGALDGKGASWQIGSQRIAFGNDPVDDGFAIGTPLLARLNEGSAVRFAGAGSVEFRESLHLGGAGSALKEITVASPSLVAKNAGIDVVLEAAKVALRGATQAAPAPDSGSATLRLVATDVAVGAGSMSISGFEATTIDASTRVRGEGDASLHVAGDLTINTGVLTTASDADVLLQSDGGLRVNHIAGSTGSLDASAQELGGSLTLSGIDVTHAGNILMPSGLVTLKATNRLEVLSDAVVDVSGREVTAGGRTAASSGGTVTLSSGGALDVAQGATLNVSGAGRSDAGDLHVRSGGTSAIAGTLLANAAAGALGGSFDLSAGALDNFSLLNSRLETGHFTESRSIATATGDLVLGAGESINARSVSLTADGGSVRIGGTVKALSDAARSRIELFGTAGVTVASTATLRADGVGAKGRGGSITLGTTSGPVSVEAGSLLSATGAAEAGTIRVRAPTVGVDDAHPFGTDINITQLAGRFEGPSSVTIEPVLRFNVGSTLTAANLTTIRNQVTSFVDTAVAGIRDRLSATGAPALSIEPGVELWRDGDITIGGAAVDFSTWRFNTNPTAQLPADRTTAAAITLRATGAITVNNTVSDGFTTQGSGTQTQLRLRTDNSSTLRFAAGASLTSANPLAVRAYSEKNFTLGTNAIIRTGTGDLSIAASGDVVFGAGSSVYTAGLALPDAPTIGLANAKSVSFPRFGGNLSISAGRDVLGQPLTAQGITAWQTRAVAQLDAGWGVDLIGFRWNAGSLGGGDVAVRAGRDVTNFSATAADGGRVVNDALVTFDGGHLLVESGRDINSAVIHVTNGYNRLEADGRLGSTRSFVDDIPAGTLLFMQNDANLSVDARRGVLLEGVFNPTSLRTQPGVGTFQQVSYVTYAPSAALRVQSAAGDVSLQLTSDNPNKLVGIVEGLAPIEGLLPPNLTLEALSRDVRLSGRFRLFQSDAGQLDIFAARDIAAASGGATIMMSAKLASDTSTPLRPLVAVPVNENEHMFSARHRDDDQPALITAGRDILGGDYKLPKSARFGAGRDIINPVVSLQNLRSTDVTSIAAGRDLRYFPGQEDGKIEVGGPGRLDVLAGRNVDLGFTFGITTDGRIRDADIDTESGADLTVIAGLARPIDGTQFLKQVIDGFDDYRKVLIAYVERETGASGLDYAGASERFKQLNPNDQRPLLLELFFRELVASGREANKDPDLGFKRGFAAIDLLFPGSRRPEDATDPGPYKGDLSLTFSRVYTLAGGNISLLAPGGLVNVGLANPPPTVNARSPSLLGIVAQQAGDVRIFTNDDVLVNSSRIFTLGGGNIAIWSTAGDIDAGRGSKSAVSAPPPVVLIDAQGRVSINFAGAVQGSGIRTISAGEDIKPGDVDLIAPAGIVNAGDAGIGAAGNLNVAASQVVGLDNIQVGGTSTGVPAETSGLGASLSGVSAVASSASSAADSSLSDGAANAQQAAPLADGALGWLDVFIEGFGEEVCKPNDTACLDRNRKKM